MPVLLYQLSALPSPATAVWKTTAIEKSVFPAIGLLPARTRKLSLPSVGSNFTTEWPLSAVFTSLGAPPELRVATMPPTLLVHVLTVALLASEFSESATQLPVSVGVVGDV